MIGGGRLVPMALAVAGTLLLGGCGGGGNTSMPPLTIDPELTAAPPDSTPPSQPVSRSAGRQPGVAARAVLKRFLRGLGAADPKVCTLVTPAYANAAFGKAPCATWVTGAGKHLTAADLAALKAVKVPTGTLSGPAFTVAFTQLTWPAIAPTQRGPLRPRFTLRKVSGHWRLAV